MECPKCGHQAPNGAHFCNNCGTPLAIEPADANLYPCPACGEMIPRSAVFCPKCGKMVRDDMAEEGAKVPGLPSVPPKEDVPTIEAEADPQSPPTAPPEGEEPAVETEPITPPSGEDGEGQTTFYRNLGIGIAAVAVIIGLLLTMRMCNGGNQRLEDLERGDSVSVTRQVTAEVENPLDVFATELSRHNLEGDNAVPSAAVFFSGNAATGTPDRIAGITIGANDGNRSFLKVYVLERSGSTWMPTLKETKFFDGRTIDMSETELRTAPGSMPRAASIGGHDAMVFAMVNLPVGSVTGGNGRVTMGLYDLDGNALHLLDYDGTIKRHDDGRTYVHGKPLQGTSSPQMKFLADEAVKVKRIYFPTEEELQAEEEERLRQEEEERLNDPDNAADVWAEENAEAMATIDKGGAAVTVKTYDKPIFNLRDTKRKVDLGGHLAFCSNDGKVYGFDKNTRKYFVIYAGGATDIARGTHGDTDLEISTAEGTLHYDLATNRLTK
ncbi:MAG: zinc ribbon domain-containing protein [Muribaculaceae bacterium]|nr:zinc ribbon domain-containing protein [Muribaculaceae bacterium]